MATKLGVQGYPDGLAEFLRRLDRPLAAVKVLEPHQFPQTPWIVGWCRERGVPVIFRYVRFFDDRNPATANPIRDMSEIIENHLVPSRLRPDFIELFNEPSTLPDALEVLMRYNTIAAQELLSLGIRAICFNFATGNMPQSKISLPPRAVLGVHEYVRYENGVLDFLQIRASRLFAPLGAEIWVTETGVEPGGHRKWGVDPIAVIRKLDFIYRSDDRYRAFIWFMAGAKFGWEDYDLAPDVDRVRAYIDEVGAPEPYWEGGAAMEIMRGIDISAYSAIDREVLRWWKAQHGIEFVVIQAHGGTPCGVGLNPKALAQARDAAAEGLKVAAYVWPPNAVMDNTVVTYLWAIQDVADGLAFVALDVESGAPVSREHIDRLRALELRPVIYSSPGEWSKVMRNTDAFKDVAYWEANYIRRFRDVLGRWNGQWPTEADRPWTPATRGGWTDSPVWQFFGSTGPGNVDLNVARRSWWEARE